VTKKIHTHKKLSIKVGSNSSLTAACKKNKGHKKLCALSRFPTVQALPCADRASATRCWGNSSCRLVITVALGQANHHLDIVGIPTPRAIEDICRPATCTCGRSRIELARWMWVCKATLRQTLSTRDISRCCAGHCRRITRTAHLKNKRVCFYLVYFPNKQTRTTASSYVFVFSKKEEGATKEKRTPTHMWDLIRVKMGRCTGPRWWWLWC